MASPPTSATKWRRSISEKPSSPIIPFAGLSVHAGDNTVEYHVSTSPGAQHANEIDRASTLAPALTEKNNKLLLEQGLHQEISYERREGNVRWRIAAYQDHIDNPVVSGGGTLSLADWNSGNLLYDPNTDLLKATGQNFFSNGVFAEMRDRINDDTWFSVSYAMGNALTMDSLPEKIGARRRHRQPASAPRRNAFGQHERQAETGRHAVARILSLAAN